MTHNTITLQVCASKMVMQADGVINLTGNLVTVDGSERVQPSSAQIDTH